MEAKILYTCRECGEGWSKWSGKCASCHSWNSLEETVPIFQRKGSPARALRISKVSLEDAFAKRKVSGIEEFDRVLGGGMTEESFILLSGDPGIGKSTLALQVGLKMAREGTAVLYVSGEESVSQVSSRAMRIGGQVPDSFSLLSSGDLDAIMVTIEKERFPIVIMDSAQTLGSPALETSTGSISQIRMMAENLMRLAKEHHTIVLLIGHVNKEGDVAGPKLLEHLVDVALFLEGEKYQDLRILRALKNRFGPVTECGIFTMGEKGFEELRNPSSFFLEGRKKDALGSAISVTLEGSRPLIIEVQGLTNRADYTYPKRTASGIDLNRLQMLSAVLSKHSSLKLEQQDVYVNIAGGLRVRDPSIDCAIAAALISSSRNVPLHRDAAFVGEIGLSGEIRPVTQEERRLKELSSLGLKTVYGHLRSDYAGLNVIPCEDVSGLSKLLT